ncbi:GTP cyclohydrolase I FolE [Alteromonas stellipolaris]|uniref:GTP cyclohydrolase I FolE n=1 Tax=Alteromonas stellipolaris TaxID=233316 RepID=UPI0026E24FBC|nr:GTP cyclohydrolase I FolE [Alteromonas stellipolaris]MDO6533781.1 GTP cyclohydrolase I FolE [Alteromonas stellipolaris]MDO6540774.1 GTP cyclohydrolase I FolE [Alteromonas stellipolaris]MDO6625225.1 GTP cyclohydrolase I FolE [Alteromonas stellipolaris]MDP2595499.1 GTP cyclohydrolase I FolE [Alteromonas stellipolaris]
MLAKEAVIVRDALEPSISESAQRVRAALEEKGLETPMVANGLSDEQKRQKIEIAMRDVMNTLGLDLTDDSLHDTPTRIAKMYVNEVFGGLDYRNFPKITQIENKMRLDQPVQVSDISLTSTCEHHFVTIDGLATVSYIPKDTIIGLSKLNRLVSFFAQRPQVQERLTQQVLVAIQTLASTDDVAVSINATHYCVKARGIRDTNSYTKTSALGGEFLSDVELRRAFFS